MIDTAANVDMGAIGNGCTWKFPNAGGCITGGRIDGSENSGTGCNSYEEGLAGVAFCVNRQPKPKIILEIRDLNS